jgi:hypothetical protein
MCDPGSTPTAIKWLSRTVEILEGEPPRRRRFDDLDAGYMVGALVLLVALWVGAR